MKKYIKKDKIIKLKLKKAICLLTIQPKDELLELYDGLYKGDEYDIYVVIDDNDFDISNAKDRFPDMHFIKIDGDKCKKEGYMNLSFRLKKGKPMSWDKAIYYFCEECKIVYSYVWFLEDDVFIPMSDTIYNIDKKYGNEDLLIKSMNIKSNNIKSNKNFELSQKEKINEFMNPELKKYLTKSMVCAIRISNLFIKKIKEYVEKNHTLFFLEVFFPTLAKSENLNIKKIDELESIFFRKVWTIDDIFQKSSNLFHPVKDVMLQKSFRRALKMNDAYFMLNREFKKKLLDNKEILLKDMHLLQIIQFKNEKNSIIKVIQDSSIHEDIIYVELYRRYKNHKFIFNMNIKSMEEIRSFLSILKYKYVSFQTIIREHYVYKNNVNVYLINIPGVAEFVYFDSHSSEKLKQCYEELGYKKEDIKTLDEVVSKSDKYFGIKTDLDMSMEFEKYKKTEKYAKKNKDIFIKLLKKQYDMYENLLELFDNKVKIYNNKLFVTK